MRGRGGPVAVGLTLLPPLVSRLAARGSRPPSECAAPEIRFNADLGASLLVARRTGARYALIGSAVAVGGEVRFSADVYEARSGELLGSAQAQDLAAYERAFALALLRIGRVCGWESPHPACAGEYFARAMALLDRLPPRTAVLLRANSPDQVLTLRQLVLRSPDDAEAWYELGKQKDRLRMFGSRLRSPREKLDLHP